MKKKMWKKITSCVLAGVMAAGLLVGCGNTDTQKESSESKPSESVSAEKTSEKASESAATETTVEKELTYPLEGGKKLSMAWGAEGPVTASGMTLDKTPFGQAWQEQTGVELEWIEITGQDGMSLMFASGDLPDIIWFQVSTYNGGAEKAIKDKVITPINDYMEYAPDLQALFDADPIVRQLSTTDSGDIIGFPFARGSEYLKTSAGMIIREDWLEDLNMEVPETADELYEVLKAFKEKKGASVPFSTTGSWWLNSIAIEHGLLTSPFGLVKGGMYQKDGEVHWGRTETEYKDVLAYLNKLYDEGLLDPNIQTVDNATMAANIMNGESGVTVGSTGGNLGTWNTTMAETDANYSLTGFGPLVAEKGDKAMSTFYSSPTTGYFAVITPACEDVELAMQFLNYGYTEEGNMLMNYGIEGESYTLKDGTAYYTDLIHNNPDGLSKQYAMALYMRSWNGGPFVQEEQYQREYANMPQQIAALERWTNTDAADYHLYELSVDEADASEYSKLKADLDTYINEMTFKFITGEVSIDKFDTEYLPMLEKLKANRVIELMQNALDKFNAK